MFYCLWFLWSKYNRVKCKECKRYTPLTIIFAMKNTRLCLHGWNTQLYLNLYPFCCHLFTSLKYSCSLHCLLIFFYERYGERRGKCTTIYQPLLLLTAIEKIGGNCIVLFNHHHESVVISNYVVRRKVRWRCMALLCIVS